jgi:putative membrane protein
MGMMDGMWDGYNSFGYPFFGWGLALIWLVLFLVIGYLVYQDANSRGMNGLLWGILVIIPMVGIIFLILYIVIRESSSQKTGLEGSKAMDILKGRYAKGELTSEQLKIMSEELKIVSRESIWEHPEPDSSNAMDILEERYAKGELTSEQLKIMSEELKNVSRNVWEDIEPDSSKAIDILKERYAKGELTSQQFKIMREDLKK